ncbi:MAG: glycosyltransferase [Verrucomicrobiae bacterium]|nr:glycosyltransferase [Verrucomicrobiae bacterium]
MTFQTKSITLVGAHGGYAGHNVPLGGSATIFECLLEEWKSRPDLSLKILSPGPGYQTWHQSLRDRNIASPQDYTRVHPSSLGYNDYARFSRFFERTATEYLCARPAPAGAWVIANDICEGPDITRLRAHGYKVMTLIHVDVVDYMTGMYLKKALSPEFLCRFWNLLRAVGINRILPDILRLIFDKQRVVMTESDAVVVPSPHMREIILRCYPDADLTRIHSIPWGNPHAGAWQSPSDDSLAAWKQKHGIRPDRFVILTLSRISPEKGLDRLLNALLLLEQNAPEAAGRCLVVIAGTAAYMEGPRTLALLKKTVSRLRLVQVIFPGHLTGTDKSCAFAAAHLYAFLSRHESYGLTLSEARAAGLPCLVSREVEALHPPEPGVTGINADQPDILSESLHLLIQNHGSSAPRIPSQTKSFSESAREILELMN